MTLQKAVSAAEKLNYYLGLLVVKFDTNIKAYVCININWWIIRKLIYICIKNIAILYVGLTYENNFKRTYFSVKLILRLSIFCYDIIQIVESMYQQKKICSILNSIQILSLEPIFQNAQIHEKFKNLKNSFKIKLLMLVLYTLIFHLSMLWINNQHAVQITLLKFIYYFPNSLTTIINVLYFTLITKVFDNFLQRINEKSHNASTSQIKYLLKMHIEVTKLSKRLIDVQKGQFLGRIFVALAVSGFGMYSCALFLLNQYGSDVVRYLINVILAHIPEMFPFYMCWRYDQLQNTVRFF